MEASRLIQDELKNIKEIKTVLECDDSENVTLIDAIDEMKRNQYINSATVSGIERYERMFHIHHKQEDLNERINNILSKYNNKSVYTEKTLLRWLDLVCGNDGYQIEIDYMNDVLTVKLEMKVKTLKKMVEEYLENIVPLQLIIVVLLLYNTHGALKRYTYGSLEEHTHEDLRGGVLT